MTYWAFHFLLQVSFENVLGEVDGMHSIDCIWRNGYKCYKGGKNCCYKFLTAVCGLCIALYWGCMFACVTFKHVWCFTPLLALYNAECGFLKKLYTIIMECCCGPCCATMGLFFSNIHVHNK